MSKKHIIIPKCNNEKYRGYWESQNLHQCGLHSIRMCFNLTKSKFTAKDVHKILDRFHKEMNNSEITSAEPENELCNDLSVYTVELLIEYMCKKQKKNIVKLTQHTHTRNRNDCIKNVIRYIKLNPIQNLSFIIHTPDMKGHYFCIKRINGCWYNLDSLQSEETARTPITYIQALVNFQRTIKPNTGSKPGFYSVLWAITEDGNIVPSDLWNVESNVKTTMNNTTKCKKCDHKFCSLINIKGKMVEHPNNRCPYFPHERFTAPEKETRKNQLQKQKWRKPIKSISRTKSFNNYTSRKTRKKSSRKSLNLEKNTKKSFNMLIKRLTARKSQRLSKSLAKLPKKNISKKNISKLSKKKSSNDTKIRYEIAQLLNTIPKSQIQNNILRDWRRETRNLPLEEKLEALKLIIKNMKLQITN